MKDYDFDLAHRFVRSICEKYGKKYEESINDSEIIILADRSFHFARSKCAELFEDNLTSHTEYSDKFIELCFEVMAMNRDNEILIGNIPQKTISNGLMDKINGLMDKIPGNEQTQNIINHVNSICDNFAKSNNEFEMIVNKIKNIIESISIGKYIRNFDIIQGIGLRPIISFNIMMMWTSLDNFDNSFYRVPAINIMKGTNMCLRYLYDTIIGRLRNSGNENIIANYDFVFNIGAYNIDDILYMYNPNCGVTKTPKNCFYIPNKFYTMKKILSVIYATNSNLLPINIIKRYVSLIINIIMHFIDENNIHGSHTRLLSQEELIPYILSYNYNVDLDDINIIEVFEKTLGKLKHDKRLIEDKRINNRLLKALDNIREFVSSNGGIVNLIGKISSQQYSNIRTIRNSNFQSRHDTVPNPIFLSKLDTIPIMSDMSEHWGMANDIIDKIKNICKNIDNNITNTIIDLIQNNKPGLSSYILVNIPPIEMMNLIQLLNLTV